MTEKIKNKSHISEWWANNPMTYGLEHGVPKYKEKDKEIHIELGSREFFERADEQFARWNNPLHGERPFSKIFPYQLYKEKSVLEIGCGMGFMAMQWAGNGSYITATDLNPVAVEQTKRRFELFGLKGEIRQEDANDLSFENNAFDYVYSWGVLHHSPDLELSLSEFFRVLKPGGRFGLMLYNRRSLLYYYHVLYVEGLLHNESEFLSPLQLASRYGDGAEKEGNPHTYPVTKKELEHMLLPYADNLKLQLFGTDLDSVFLFMLPGISMITPRIVKKAWARRFGWSIWAHGEKRVRN